MGGVVSQGDDNEELVDNLVKAEYITCHTIEQAFRLVDRGDYFLEEFVSQAYKDLAWRHENLHLSAPCIYAEVLTHLDLQPGHAFLNVGSGTGYLSTVAGLLIGSIGVNHGIELHCNVVEYARGRLADMILNSASIDMVDFSVPIFISGNVLHLQYTPSLGVYDRVYCGAAVNVEHINLFKSLINIGGKLIMPTDEQLVKVTRTGFDTWETTNLLPVSFATLVTPVEEEGETPLRINLPEVHGLSLKELCRSVIRNQIRQSVKCENPELKVSNQVAVTRQNGSSRPRRSNRRIIRHVIFPLTDDENDSEGDEASDNRINGTEALRYLGHVITVGNDPEHGDEDNDSGMSLDDHSALPQPNEEDDLPQLSSSPVPIAQSNGPTIQADSSMEDSHMDYDMGSSRARHHSPSSSLESSAKKFCGMNDVDLDEESRDEGKRADRVAAVTRHKNNVNIFSNVFKGKISKLPLPNNLKDYINMYRAFP